jgi:hypothetical protein
MPRLYDKKIERRYTPDDDLKSAVELVEAEGATIFAEADSGNTVEVPFFFVLRRKPF